MSSIFRMFIHGFHSCVLTPKEHWDMQDVRFLWLRSCRGVHPKPKDALCETWNLTLESLPLSALSKQLSLVKMSHLQKQLLKIARSCHWLYAMFILLAVIWAPGSDLVTSLMNVGVEWKLGMGKKASVSWVGFLTSYDSSFLSLQQLHGLECCSVYCQHSGGQLNFNTSTFGDIMRPTVSRPWILSHTAPNVSLFHLSVLYRVSFFPSHFCTRFVHIPSVVSLQPTYSLLAYFPNLALLK